MDISLSPNQVYTYSDYLTWADNVRRELFNGIVKLMSPALARRHQDITIELLYNFKSFLKDKKCRVYCAPFDVRLPKGNLIDDKFVTTIVQPDICIVCDPLKLDKNGCIGAPDLIAEIVSPGSESRDVKEKFQIYEEAGVLEYWIVRPEEKSIHVFLLSEKGKYELGGIYMDSDCVPVAIFQHELEIDLAIVFKE